MMQVEKHKDGLREVLDEIETALEDAGGLTIHQRRLALMLSLGSAELLEIYLHRLDLMKSGARIKHDWLGRKRSREKLDDQVTGDLDSVERLDDILSKAREIERSRNDLAYGSPSTDEELKQLIDLFFEIKEAVEDETGDILES